MKNNPLIQYASNTYSQFGEDGILESIFKKLKVKNPWCVEFGAWDGIAFSNTRSLIEKDWQAVLIEPNPRKFKELVKNNQQFPGVHLLQKFITLSGSDSLDTLLESTPIPRRFDLLSIDIDGNDYHIWRSLKKYKPKVVIIEFNPTIPPDVKFIQPADFSVQQGSSLKALYELAQKKGYELICCTEANAIFVDSKYFSVFKISNNTPENMMEYKYQTRIYQLFDGTIKVEGNTTLLWSNIPFTENDMQILPPFFRRFPEGVKNIALLKFYKKFREVFNS